LPEESSEVSRKLDELVVVVEFDAPSARPAKADAARTAEAPFIVNAKRKNEIGNDCVRRKECIVKEEKND
jgi:hypothetical protein